MPVFLAVLPFLGIIGSDPAPSVLRKAEVSRRLDCERVAGDVAERTRRGYVKPSRPRGSFAERDVLACRERLLPEGVREPRDEAVLRTLEERVSQVATQVAALRADLAGRTWLVEVFYPNVRVGTKIGFATKAALMRESLSVSDRLPLLSASDLEVLHSLPPKEAYPAACARWQATGQLRDNDVLLALVTRDLRETNLHTGLCIEGRWSWLR